MLLWHDLQYFQNIIKSIIRMIPTLLSMHWAYATVWERMLWFIWLSILFRFYLLLFTSQSCLLLNGLLTSPGMWRYSLCSKLCTPTAWYNMQPFFSIRELPCSQRYFLPWIGWIGVLLSYTSISLDQIPSSADVSTIITTCSLSKYGYAIPKLSSRTNVARVNNTARNV